MQSFVRVSDCMMSQIPAVISLEETPSLSPEVVLICQNPIEESEQVAALPTLSSENIQRSTSFSSDTLETVDTNPSDTQTEIENLSDADPSNPTMVVITSPSFNSDLSSEQNDSLDPLNSSSVSFLQTTQRHRRNKSEPVKSASTEDLTSTTNNDSSSLSNNARDELRRKSSTKMKPITHEKSPPQSTASRKKKAWYNPFQSTYRQRNEEFRKIFKDLPTDERLIVDYSCAWQKDILVQGRMYLSANYLCFYANILNWKSSLCLKYKDISSITREKTAKVISNAIEIKSNKGEKYFFASLVTRDKTYTLLSRLWQAVSTDQPISTQQIWVIIHENYGDDLDLTTDEEDNDTKPSLSLPSPKSPIQSNNKYDLSNIVLRVTPNSIQSKSDQQEDDRSSISSHGEHQTDDENIMPVVEELTKKEDINPILERCYLTECLCESHLATEVINRTYSMSVERLFDCIFGDNDFLVAYRTSRRIKDFHATEWQVNDETGKRERLCTYKVVVSAVFGSTTICSNERQIIISELSNSHYIVDTEVRNEGIKYADTFFVASRYCLVQIGPNKCHLKLTCEVRYIKSLMAIIKTFIEKNAMAALQDSFTDLMKRIDQESSKQSRTLNTNNNKEKVTPSHSVTNRRSSRHLQSDDYSSSTNNLSRTSQQDEELTPDQDSDLVLPDPIFSSRNTFLTPFCIITMVLLLIVNIFLCIKLNQIDHMTDRLVQSYPAWLNQYPYQGEDNQWSLLLKKQEDYYQSQLINLQSVLLTTHNALKNVTNALHHLSQLSSGSS